MAVPPPNTKTEIEVIEALNQQGYTSPFVFKDGKLECTETGKRYAVNDLVIDQQFRFEGMSNPSDSSILFALRSMDGTKGTIVSAYGIYANLDLVDFMNELEMKMKDNTNRKV